MLNSQPIKYAYDLRLVRTTPTRKEIACSKPQRQDETGIHTNQVFYSYHMDIHHRHGNCQEPKEDNLRRQTFHKYTCDLGWYPHNRS